MHRRLTRKNCFEALESRQLLTVSIYEQEPNNSISSATLVQLPINGQATLVGELASGDSRDFFKLTPVGDFTGQLYVNVRSNGPKPRLEIQNASGHALFQTKPEDNVNSGTININLGQTYFIRLRDNSTYAVDLHLPTVQHAVDDYAWAVEGDDSIEINALANDIGLSPTDPVTIVSVDTLGILGNVEIGEDGDNIIYTPGNIAGLEVGQTIVEAIPYTISYGGGAVTASATIYVEVHGKNHVPIAQNDVSETSANAGTLRIEVLVNDSDSDVFDSLRIVNVDAPSVLGQASVASDGGAIDFNLGQSYDWLVDGQQYIETIGYTIEDDWGAQASATLSLVIVGVNNSPVALADTLSILDSDRPVWIDVLSNDYDRDQGDDFYITTATASIGAVNIAADGKSIQYSSQGGYQSLRAGQTGSGLITYTIRDLAGLESTATVSVSVSGTNQSPNAVNDQFTVSEDANATFLSVLQNDQDADQGDLKRVVSVQSLGMLGLVQVASNRTGLVFLNNNAYHHLAPGQSIAEVATYVMEDSAGLQSMATVTITVQGVNDNPIAVSDSFSVQKSFSSYSLGVLANDHDVDVGDTNSLRIVDIDSSEIPGHIELILIYGVGVGVWVPGIPAALGTFEIAADGKSLQYTPGTAFAHLGPGQSAVDAFRYTVEDRWGGRSTVSATVIVHGNATAPASQIVASYVHHRGATSSSNIATFSSTIDSVATLDTGKQLAKEGSSTQPLDFSNLINTTRGINGLVFDVANLPATTLDAADFQFQWSPQGAFEEAANPPASWQTAPSPSLINVLPGETPRIVLEWPDQSIMNRWLRVTIKANARTGLAQPEVYYLGHLLGETTGPSEGKFTVLVADVLQIRSALSSPTNASSILDLDKSGVVLVSDILAARSQLSQQLTQISIPAVGGGSGNFSGDSESNSIASTTLTETTSNFDSLRSSQFEAAAYAVAVDQALDNLYSPQERRRGRK